MTSARALRLAVFAGVLACSNRDNAVAQSAEPVRIDFKPGTSSTRLTGSLRGRQQMSYAVAAKKNQRLTLSIKSAAANKLTVQVKSPENADVAMAQSKPSKQWNGLLPQTGDYEIWVVRGGGAGISYYSLTVAIK